MKKETKYVHCVVSTGAMNYDTQNETIIQYNHQLYNWKQAKIKYTQIKDSNFLDPSLIKDLIITLGQSLTDLFGVNYSGELNPQNPERTPSLLEFIKTVFPSRGWVLVDDDKDLYDAFINFDEIHKDVGKHISLLKLGKIERLTLKDINIYMESVRNVWIWFLRKKINNPTAQDLEEFIESY